MNRLLAILVHSRLWPVDDERGDVPGWVLVTVMTAGLVMGLWGLADDQLRQMLRDALDSVKN
ncbi:hypothetical protein ISU10_01595 [Nocardioides agariphilus]|jgi:hypothetical protein|uniref:Uncharacterized protein n=1 Tax=Nocardioides agariphilus TaxID=433664 RepID=A0A930VH19_9ACTN|nr:hypothetical protein [Nocardioides agariphilus]MBF4766457.1 hypothetical protein [Nocardioides agariphilus]